MSANAIYLLFWCTEYNINGKRKTLLNDDEDPKELEHFELKYWLDTIQHYGGSGSDAVPIAAQNKMDNLSDKLRIDQALHDKYKINDSFHFSLRLGSNDANIREHASLQHFITELAYRIGDAADHVSIPPHWQKIRDWILELKKGNENAFSGLVKFELFINIPDFVSACNQLLETPLSEGEIYTIPRWLNTCGVAVFFPDIKNLSDKLFIKPDDLAQKIYQILNQKVFEKKGQFSAADIDQIVKPEIKLIFLDMAKHLELIFPHPNSEKDFYIAPQYLPDNHPMDDLYKIASRSLWKSSFWIKIPLFYYKRVLQNLLLYFTAPNRSDCKYFWKHGLLFTRQENGALIKGLYPNENEKEGVILFSLEKSGNEGTELYKEIFGIVLKVLRIEPADLLEGMGNFFADGATGPTSIRDEIEKARELLLSYDGTNYAAYFDLLANRNEAKIKALNSNVFLLMKHFEPVLPFKPTLAKKVFLSYSHHDTRWLNRLRAHLAGLRRSNIIESWDDKEILPGALWDQSIKTSLEESDVYILLLSADFISSDYIWNIEWRTAIEKFNTRGAIVIPVLCEPFDLGSNLAVTSTLDSKGLKLGDFEIVPKTKDGALLALSSWTNPEEALTVVTERIRTVLMA